MASKNLGGKASRIYWGDNNASGDLSVRDVKEDIELSARARLINPRWIKELKNHGFKGAESVSSRVNNLYKWSALTQKVDKWVFDEVVATYIHTEENLSWLRHENPYALEELTPAAFRGPFQRALAGRCRRSGRGPGRSPGD